MPGDGRKAMEDHITFNYKPEKPKDKYADLKARQDQIGNLSDFMSAQQIQHQKQASQVKNNFEADVPQEQPSAKKNLQRPGNINLNEEQVMREERQRVQEAASQKHHSVSIFDKPTQQPQTRKMFSEHGKQPITSDSGICWESEEQQLTVKPRNEEPASNNMFLHGQKEDIKWK